MKINTFNMTTAVMQIGGAESEAQLLAFKTKFKSILSSLYIGVAFLVAALWMSQPSSKMEMATLLIPAEAYDILSTGFSPVP